MYFDERVFFAAVSSIKEYEEYLRDHTNGYLSSINKIANVLTKLYTSGNVIRNV